MLRHKVMVRRLMYHHHIITRDEDELIKKIYCKQKEDKIKGDWFQTLEADFDFIEVTMDEDVIKGIPKDQYKKLVNTKVKQAAFKSYMQLKDK